MINRSNYEVWFVDFLDGKLTDEQLIHFHAFLAENPDLGAELDDFSTDLPTILPETAKISIAKKEISAVGSLNEHSFETAFIAYHENDLSEPEKQELELFLVKNPFLQREFALFGQVTLTHSGESFPQKRSLKRSVPLQAFYRYGAAASVLLLLGMGAVWYTGLDRSAGSGLAYQPTKIQVPAVAVTDTYVNVSGYPAEPSNGVSEQKTSLVSVPERVRFDGIAKNRPEPFTPVEGMNLEPALAQTPSLYDSRPQTPASDEMTLVQALGKAIETGVGENGMADGLQDDRKITAGDMLDLASTPFKKSGAPVLATDNTPGGKRRFKVRLGIFEADFALK